MRYCCIFFQLAAPSHLQTEACVLRPLNICGPLSCLLCILFLVMLIIKQEKEYVFDFILHHMTQKPFYASYSVLILIGNKSYPPLTKKITIIGRVYLENPDKLIT